MIYEYIIILYIYAHTCHILELILQDITFSGRQLPSLVRYPPRSLDCIKFTIAVAAIHPNPFLFGGFGT